MHKFSIAAMVAMAAIANAENTATSVGTATAPTTTTLGAKMVGGIELRPSWATDSGKVTTDNNVELGYQWNSNSRVIVHQDFGTNIYDPATAGLNFQLKDLQIKAGLDNVWKDDQGWSLELEPKIVLPVDAEKRSAGFITAATTQVKILKKVSNSVTLSLADAPIFMAYGQAGSTTSAGAEANPFFKNELGFEVAWQIARGLKFTLPIMLHQSRHANFQGGAKYNNRWNHKLWIFPELTYAVSTQFTVGLAAMSDNLIRDDFSGFDLGGGFSKTTGQLIVKASL